MWWNDRIAGRQADKQASKLIRNWKSSSMCFVEILKLLFLFFIALKSYTSCLGLDAVCKRLNICIYFSKSNAAGELRMQSIWVGFDWIACDINQSV